MVAPLLPLEARLDRFVRSPRGLAFLSILAACLAMLAPGSALADDEYSPDLWTRMVLAAVRVVLWVLRLPPINACPC